MLDLLLRSKVSHDSTLPQNDLAFSIEKIESSQICLECLDTSQALLQQRWFVGMAGTLIDNSLVQQQWSISRDDLAHIQITASEKIMVCRDSLACLRSTNDDSVVYRLHFTTLRSCMAENMIAWA